MSDLVASAHDNVEQTLGEINRAKLTHHHSYYPSPWNWQDEVLYFLFLDRFSDGTEAGGYRNIQGQETSSGRSTPLFDLTKDNQNVDFTTWFEAGKTWCGGHINGVNDKLGYLKRMGITAIWLSPVFKQVSRSHDYHGYGIQNFLDVDPHFGTRDDLKTLVAAAHRAGIRVILDIILNHAGNVFAYHNNQVYQYFDGQVFPVQGFRASSDDAGSIPFEPIDLNDRPQAWPDQAIWPREFQSASVWTRKGQINHWEGYPEYLEGDFLSLKDINNGAAPKDPAISWDVIRRINEFEKHPPLDYLCEVYKFWIAFADVDGFRIDTVKHMEPGAVRYFSNVIHEYAQSLGKENFYLIGEITGGRAHACNLMDKTGINAALGINDIPDKLENLAKGWRQPGNPNTAAQEGYFDLFRNSVLDDKHSHQWYGEHIVTMFDDHDQVGVEPKYRFARRNTNDYQFLPLAIGLNLTTLGIPCLYYGTEQGFNGTDIRTHERAFSDVVLRECMFGGPFGSFQSQGRHFFNEQHEIYCLIQNICRLRTELLPLRRGRQYQRPIAAHQDHFFYPQALNGQLRYVVAWSRLFSDQEVVCAINTDPEHAITVWITVDHALQQNKVFVCRLSTQADQVGQSVAVDNINGSAIRVTVPPAGFVIYSPE